MYGVEHNNLCGTSNNNRTLSFQQASPFVNTIAGVALTLANKICTTLYTHPRGSDEHRYTASNRQHLSFFFLRYCQNLSSPNRSSFLDFSEISPQLVNNLPARTSDGCSSRHRPQRLVLSVGTKLSQERLMKKIKHILYRA